VNIFSVIINWLRGLSIDENRLNCKIDVLAAKITQLENKVMAEIDDLKAAVANDTTVEQSAITLINGFAAMLAAALASNDTDLRAAVEDVANTVNTNATALASAVSAGTPPAAAKS
jgi:outer membrane murein-binding lipoprotein Lpp